MNIVTEPKLSGKPIADKPHKRPVRLVLWFLIVGLLLAAIVGVLVFFKFVFLPNLFKQIFSKPPPPMLKAIRVTAPPAARATWASVSGCPPRPAKRK